jgi:hypothetical protein
MVFEGGVSRRGARKPNVTTSSGLLLDVDDDDDYFGPYGRGRANFFRDEYGRPRWRRCGWLLALLVIVVAAAVALGTLPGPRPPAPGPRPRINRLVLGQGPSYGHPAEMSRCEDQSKNRHIVYQSAFLWHALAICMHLCALGGHVHLLWRTRFAHGRMLTVYLGDLA